MRHRRQGRKLNRDTAHRLALRRNLARALFLSHRIVTTVEKAKFAKAFTERLITLARENTPANQALVRSRITDKTVVKKLFDVIGPHFKARAGGYTRILRLAKNRLGDDASQAVFELVDLPREKAEATAE
ncbi:MAG: 50S ribosomal protein L17 [Planctomycetes bacterium]|nr:50S ribosomal protein L17 [Planctomycetota bacterium]